GTSKSDESNGHVTREIVNTRYSFEIELPQTDRSYNMLFMKNITGIDPIGGYRINNKNGTSNSYSYPSVIDSNDFQFVRFFTGNAISITKSGTTRDEDSKIEYRIVKVPATNN